MELPQITQHIHLDSIDSTQIYLQDFFKSHKGNILISTMEQTSGFGRRGKTWVHQENSLAFSFTLPPCEVPTLTPLEISVLISEYFEKAFKVPLKVKWPNDLINEEGKKCGGILINNIEETLIVGVGINTSLNRDIEKRDLFPAGLVDIPTRQKDIPQKIYQYILENRLSPETISARWLKRCVHLGQKVEIDGAFGNFDGIGELGEALVDNKKVYSGTLNFLP